MFYIGFKEHTVDGRNPAIITERGTINSSNGKWARIEDVIHIEDGYIPASYGSERCFEK